MSTIVNQEEFQIEAKTENSLDYGNQSIEINLVQQLLIEDGEEIESVEGVDLSQDIFNSRNLSSDPDTWISRCRISRRLSEI